VHPPEKVEKLSLSKLVPQRKRRTFEEVNSPLQRLGGYCWYHKKGYPNQNNKNHKKTKQTIHDHQGAGPTSSDSSVSGPNHGSPDPLASDVSSISPDPSRARTTDTASPDPLGLGRKFRLARTHDVTGVVTPISQQGMEVTFPTTLVTAALPLSLCDLTSFTVVYRPTVKEEWERLTSVTVSYLFPLLTGQAAVSPIRPPRHQQGSVTLHRSSHIVSHASRTGWAIFYRVGTVASPLSRRNLQSLL